MIKMVVCDLDGTLLDKNKELLEENVEVLKTVQENGVVLVLATGRNMVGLEHIYSKLGMDTYNNGYLVTVNGLQRYRFSDKQVIINEGLTRADVTVVKQAAAKLGYIAFAFHDNASYISGGRMIHWIMNNSFLQKRLLSSGYDGRLPSPRFSPYEESFDGVTKMCVQCPTFFLTNSKKVRSLLKDYSVMTVSPGWYEIMPHGINKSDGVKSIMEELAIDPEEVLIFGDSENDLEMLKLTPNSYAMDNAMDMIKEVANHTISSHNQPGIGQVILEQIKEIR
ncbi:HAD family hydrolase [Tannockella kyphosi]|uniref:HAD family hydrolase n=1 Tax=Tannockella kyphosi TaxID=2899121 RepID=UPI002012F882|nr:HAD family hydrolase [Tannockella kyphosi]